MNKQIRRRDFIIFGSAATGSILLKACTETPPTEGIRPATPTATFAATGDTIKVGILHSLSGSMAALEKGSVDAENLAIAEINQAGGLLGKQIEAIVEDAASDAPTFAEKVKKLIDKDKVVTIFGGWSFASRKAALPVFEAKKHLLWYPVAYEGQECSRNIFYTGAVPNQQIEPSVQWLLDNKGKDFFLIGSDYMVSRTVNTIVAAQLKTKGGKLAGEYYIPRNAIEMRLAIAKIKAALPKGGVIYNSLQGDSNAAFFKTLQTSGMNADKYPVMSVSMAEEEVQAIGGELLKGHYGAGSYFQTIETPANQQFVAAFKARYGKEVLISDPMEAAYIMVYLWKQAVEKAKTATDLEAVKQAAYGQTFDAPGGMVTMNSNHHLSKWIRIGEVGADGLFRIVFETKEALKPLPWSQLVEDSKGFACDWSNPKQGGRYKMT